MKKKILGFLMIILFTLTSISAQETVKVMFYNLLNYPLEDAVPNRLTDLSYILSDYEPDLFLVCKLNNSTGANDVLKTVQMNLETKQHDDVSLLNSGLYYLTTSRRYINPLKFIIL